MGLAWRRRAAGASALALVLLVAGPGDAYRHHTSRIHYQEHSAAVFERARQEGKPVFLLISATWCYWCKYFDEQALETDAVAEFLNRHYLSVFVDSDLRPDLTRTYARGWPMTVLFDPEGRVRIAFPGALRAEDMLGVLRRVRDEVRAAPRLPGPAPAATAPAGPPVPVTPEQHRLLMQGLARWVDEHADLARGGFGDGRRFPHPGLLGFLLGPGDVQPAARQRPVLERTLDAILAALFDPIEGGFFRYAERADWTEPHTEKLLAPNARLALVFHRAGPRLGKPAYTRAADATLTFLLQRLYDRREGGFYGSVSADPEYYGRPPAGRRAAARPPVNRDKIAAWNAEAVLTLLAIGRATGRRDLLDAADRTVEFMLARLVTGGGVFHAYREASGRGYLPGRAEAAAWVARALLESHRATGRAAHRETAVRILDRALADLFDRERGLFVESAASREVAMDVNGIAAEALLRSGRPSHRAAALRVLGAVGGELRARLAAAADPSPARVDETVLALEAWARALGKD